MKLRKKLLSTLLATAVCIGTLSGCAGGTTTPKDVESSPESKESGAADTETDTAKSGRPSISIALPSLPTGTGKDSEMELWLEETFNVDLDLIALPSDSEDRQTQINLMMSDDELRPDVIWFNENNAKEYEQWRDAGLLVDLYPVLKENGTHMVTYYTDTDQLNALFSTYEDGKMYRLIADVSEPGSTSTVVRKDWMEQFGMNEITTIDQYVDYLRKCVRDDPDGDGQVNTVGLSGSKNEAMLALYPFWGAYGTNPEEWFVQEDGSIKYGAILPETRDAIAAISKVYQEGLIDSNLITGAKDFNAELWPEGKVGAFYTWSYFLTPAFSPGADFKNKNPEGEYIRIEPVAGPDGFKSDRPSSPYGSGYISITNKCEDPVAAFRLLDGILEPMNSIWLKNGEEGVDYRMVDGEMEILTDKEAQDAKGIGIFTIYLERKDAYNIEIGVEGNARFAAGQKASEPLREKIAFLREKARPEWNAKQSVLKDLYQTTFWGIVTGELPIEAFDSFVEEWYAQGGEAVELEANEYWAKQQIQYEEFMSKYETELAPLVVEYDYDIEALTGAKE